MTFLKGHWQLIVILSVLFLLWNTPVAIPLKILIVYLHELAHGLAAVLTGGSIVEISLSPQQGGHAITRGGSRFLTLTAGYLGSLLLGLALLLIALRTEADRLVLGAFAVVTLLVAVFYVRDLFALAFCIAMGLAMLGIARYLDHSVSDMVLRVIGLASILYVPYDIFDDTIRRSGARSDAYMLAEEFGGPTIFWGGLWLIISLAVIVFALRHGLGQASNISFRKT
ncbi:MULTISPECIES: M50 family metallopeptidase [unclassified Roseibium]|uniref:M50 family metallopeptidase n=1 Tax=unclassified Roseibium TaxID=2629323 RepID=UPI0031767092